MAPVAAHSPAGVDLPVHERGAVVDALQVMVVQVSQAWSHDHHLVVVVQAPDRLVAVEVQVVVTVGAIFIQTHPRTLSVNKNWKITFWTKYRSKKDLTYKLFYLRLL